MTEAISGPDSARIEMAVKELCSGELKRQIEAHDLLMELAVSPENSEALAAAVMPLVADCSPQIRATALLVLGLVLGAGSLEILERRASDAEEGVRLSLAYAAANIGEAAERLLLRLVDDKAPSVRFAAALGLAEFGNNKGVEALIEGLDRVESRFDALVALRILGDQKAAVPARKWFKKFFVSRFERTAAAGVLAKLGDPEARKWIVGRVSNRKAEDKGLVIEIVAELGFSEAIPALKNVLRDTSDIFRGAAARAIGKLRDEGLVAELANLLRDEAEDIDVRVDAAEGLASMKSTRANKLLENFLGLSKSKELTGVIEKLLRNSES